MSDMTVKDFAAKVGRDVPRLLEQMKEAGLEHKSETDAVSEEDKRRLLDYLTKSHGGDTSAAAPKNRITLTRKTRSRIKTGERGKTIEVQVRKKRTYVKRAEEEAKPEPVEDAGPRQLVGDMADSQQARAEQEARDAEAAKARAAEESARELDAFEYQCGRGVRLGLDKARQMAADAAVRDILFSVHAPYYISMSSLEEDKRLNSVNYLLQSAAVCKALGGQRVIFHSGSCGRQSREAALEKALDTMRRAQAALDEAGFSDITLCPETMGKIGQLGTLDEVLALCRVDRRITPCIDFGHLNARTLGGIASKADYAAILDRMEEALGDARARQFQVHFSRIEYTAGGEKRHWTFAETQFGPEPQPLMELLAERRLEPVIICESAGTQAEDARTMAEMYGRANPLRQR